MSTSPERPYSARLSYWRTWAARYDAKLERPKPGVLVLIHKGYRHVYQLNKHYSDGRYAWCSTMPVDFLAQATRAYIKANPDIVEAFSRR